MREAAVGIAPPAPKGKRKLSVAVEQHAQDSLNATRGKARPKVARGISNKSGQRECSDCKRHNKTRTDHRANSSNCPYKDCMCKCKPLAHVGCSCKCSLPTRPQEAEGASLEEFITEEEELPMTQQPPQVQTAEAQANGNAKVTDENA